MEVAATKNDQDSPILTIGDFYKITKKSHSRFGHIGKCTDVQYPITRDSLCTIRFRDGIYGVFRYEELEEAFSNMPSPGEWSRVGDTMECEVKRPHDELLDTGSSFKKAERDRLFSAHEDRVKGYKKEAAQQVKKIQAMDNVDKILNKRIKQREELASWEDGTWFDTHWEPDYRKIGFTAGLQGMNLFMLASCILSGGLFTVIGPVLFTAMLGANYYVLKNNLLRNEE